MALWKNTSRRKECMCWTLTLIRRYRWMSTIYGIPACVVALVNSLGGYVYVYFGTCTTTRIYHSKGWHRWVWTLQKEWHTWLSRSLYTETLQQETACRLLLFPTVHNSFRSNCANLNDNSLSHFSRHGCHICKPTSMALYLHTPHVLCTMCMALSFLLLYVQGW